MIILLGYMGSGKSAIGKALAANLQLPFYDLDAYIETAEGVTISEIFKNKGEIYFRKAESTYLKLLLDEAPEAIVSLGGGTPCYAGNMDFLKTKTQNTFYLNVSIPNLALRLSKEKEHRPMIAHLSEEELIEFIGKHLFERNVFYQQAVHTVNCNGKTIAEIVAEITGIYVK